jgi:hypothetical protein
MGSMILSIQPGNAIAGVGLLFIGRLHRSKEFLLVILADTFPERSIA